MVGLWLSQFLGEADCLRKLVSVRKECAKEKEKEEEEIEFLAQLASQGLDLSDCLLVWGV
jgi:hypothetical protein